MSRTHEIWLIIACAFLYRWIYGVPLVIPIAHPTTMVDLTIDPVILYFVYCSALPWLVPVLYLFVDRIAGVPL